MSPNFFSNLATFADSEGISTGLWGVLGDREFSCSSMFAILSTSLFALGFV